MSLTITWAKTSHEIILGTTQGWIYIWIFILFYYKSCINQTVTTEKNCHRIQTE
jgi:hypothetical protein